MQNCKLDTLKAFLSEYEHLPEQGSDEWKEQRMDRIGGSELATILKKNKYKSVNKLIMEKLNFDRFTGSVVTYWGNVFEELIRLHTEEIFNCSVYETGSIPYHKGYLSYSPDGVGVVSKQAISKYMKLSHMKLDDSHKEYLTLFEFKCPHSRLPDYNVPEHYLPQITVGMNIIDIMEVGVFIQAVYRRCIFSDIAYNHMHNGFGHFKRASCDGIPKETGFMVMHCDDTAYVSDLIDYIKNESRNKFINGVLDISSIYESELFEEIMKECVNKRIKIDYTYREKYNESVFQSDGMTKAFYNASLQYRATKALKKAIDKHGDTIVGILPFKLLDVFITPIAKDPTYIESTKALSKAKSIVDCINDLRKIGGTVKADVAKSVRAYKL